MRELFTVGAALPVYNGERFLAEALQSILVQTHPVRDIVVVDDGSDDASRHVASEVGPPVRVVGLPHVGVGAARSEAVRRVRGEIILFLDADDLLTPDSVACRIELFANRPDLDIVYGQIRSFSVCGENGPIPLDEARPGHVAGAMLARRSALHRVGPFASDLEVSEGLDWLLRARETGLREATVQRLVQWRRVHGANNSIVHGNSRREMARVLKRSLDRRRARRAD